MMEAGSHDLLQLLNVLRVRLPGRCTTEVGSSEPRRSPRGAAHVLVHTPKDVGLRQSQRRIRVGGLRHVAAARLDAPLKRLSGAGGYCGIRRAPADSRQASAADDSADRQREVVRIAAMRVARGAVGRSGEAVRGEHQLHSAATCASWCAALDSGGALTVLEAGSSGRSGPPLHIHSAQEETIHVLDGELRWRLGDEVQSAGTGTFVFIPRGLRTASRWWASVRRGC